MQRTFVYVSNAGDGDIGIYRMDGDGRLNPIGRVEASRLAMPMSVSPDRRFLFAAIRTEPYRAVTYAIHHRTGALKPVRQGPLADSFPYIHVDRSGQYLLGASYGGHKVSVNAIAGNGRVSAPLQVIPTARHAHAILPDRTNRFVFVPHLGTDQILQFRFSAKTGRLAANTPPLVQMPPGTGPRHIVLSRDNRFAYVLNELTGTVAVLSLDGKRGLLTPVGEASILPPESRLRPGTPRGPIGGSGKASRRDRTKDIWASDLHLTPDGRYLYAAERTGSTIGALRVDPARGTLAFLESTPTERQPRSFAIDPAGSFLVASGELSDTISVYAIDESGSLRLLQRYPSGRSSNWVEIVSLD